MSSREWATVVVMKNLFVFFYIDALNSSFLNSDIMPFLSGLATKHSYYELENVLGYSFAIQSCMLSGKYPEETNHWMPYFYSQKESPLLFKTLNKIGTIFPLDSLQSLRSLMVMGTRKFFVKNGAQANNIPLCEIDKMAVYPYYYMCELPFFFELKESLEKTSQTALTYLGPPKIRTSLHASLIQYIETSEHENEVIIAYDDALDGLGHMLGPHAFQCQCYAKSVDRTLCAIYRKLTNAFGEHVTLFFFSDHGQTELSYQLDLLSEFDRRGLKLGDDYLCFVDATLALFWPKNYEIKRKIFDILCRIEGGKVIDEALKRKYHINFDDKRYGEMVFVLKPGGSFVPNFFSPFGAMKGLHGYLPEEDVQKGFLISDKKFSYNLEHVKDVKSFLLNICACER